MNTVHEIETAIEMLPAKQRWDLFHTLHDRLWDQWDKQIEEDSAAGRLDHLIQEAEADIAAGRTRPLDEVINDA
jgi:hypothetical protein